MMLFLLFLVSGSFSYGMDLSLSYDRQILFDQRVMAAKLVECFVQDVHNDQRFNKIALQFNVQHVYRDYSNNLVISTFGSNTYHAFFIKTNTVVVCDYDVSRHKISAKTIFDMSGAQVKVAEFFGSSSTQLPIEITMINGKFVAKSIAKS